MAEQNTDSVTSDVEKTISTPGGPNPKNKEELKQYILHVQSLLQNMQDKFQDMSDQLINRIDDMSTRVEELEKNITYILVEAGEENEK